MNNQHNIDAVVHMPIPPNGYRVKVSIHDLGIHINGMVVFTPSDKHDRWSVFTPQSPSRSGGRFRTVEFNKKLPLWGEIEKACIAAVRDYDDTIDKDTQVLESGSPEEVDQMLKNLPF